MIVLAIASNECRRMTAENKNVGNNDSKKQLKMYNFNAVVKTK